MNRIGAIGQGPGEYRRFYNMAINETDRIIYVYCMDTSALLSFSYEGTFLINILFNFLKNGHGSFTIWKINSIFIIL